MLKNQKFRIMLGMSAVGSPDAPEIQRMWHLLNGIHLDSQRGSAYSRWDDDKIMEWPREFHYDGDSYIQRVTLNIRDLYDPEGSVATSTPEEQLRAAELYLQDMYGTNEPHHCAVLDAGGDCCGHWIPSFVEVWGGGDGVFHGTVHVSMNV